MKKRIVEMILRDGGDGSTNMHIIFDDGTETWAGPDIPYDGCAILRVDADGEITEETIDKE